MFASPTVNTRISLCLIAVMVALGCSSAPPEHRGSTLSQAATEAEKNETEKKKALATTPKEEQGPNTAVAAGTVGGELLLADSDSSQVPTTEPVETEDHDRYAVSLIGGGGSLRSEQFDGFGAFGLGGSIMEKRIRADLWLFYIPTNLSEQSGLVDALEDEHELAMDFRFRYSFTPEYTFAGIYGLIGGRVGMLEWNYANTIYVPDDAGNPQAINDDDLTFYEGYIGAGIAPVQTNHFLLNVDFSVGFKTYENYTSQGFKQDLFDDYIGFGQLLFSGDYRF